MKDISTTPAYVAFYPMLAEIARKCGYSLCIHGSVARDMDLVAIPWVINARSVEELVEALKSYIDSTMRLMFKDPVTLHGPEHKPYQRIAYTIQIGNGAVIDLSIMDTIIKPQPSFDALSETDKQILTVMLTNGTDKQKQEALMILNT